MVFKIQAVEKLNNSTTTAALFAWLFLTVVKFKLFERLHSHKNKETLYPFSFI